MKDVLFKHKKWIFLIFFMLVFITLVYYIIFGIVELFQAAKSFQNIETSKDGGQQKNVKQSDLQTFNEKSYSDFSSGGSDAQNDHGVFTIFYNFECPLCRASFSDVQKILRMKDEYQDNYYHAPDRQGGSLISKAAKCAANQRKLPDFLKIAYINYGQKAGNTIREKEKLMKKRLGGWKNIFRNKREPAVQRQRPEQNRPQRTVPNNRANIRSMNDEIMQYASAAGLELKIFSECLKSPETITFIKEKQQIMTERKIQTLPALYQNYAVFMGEEAIEKLKRNF